MATTYRLSYTADEINEKLGEVVDQNYDAQSENAQSGLAVSEALSSVRDFILLNDNSTNETYKVYILNGKLTMELMGGN